MLQCLKEVCFCMCVTVYGAVQCMVWPKRRYVSVYVWCCTAYGLA